MNEIFDKIAVCVDTLLKGRPAHLIDEALIKHSIVDLLLKELANSRDIGTLQTEKTSTKTAISRCDIFFRYGKEDIFLELKWNRLVLKVNDGVLSGGNGFKGDVEGILKDVAALQNTRHGSPYLLLLYQMDGVYLDQERKKKRRRSIVEYCEKTGDSSSKQLLRILAGKDPVCKIILERECKGSVNGREVPFRLCIYSFKEENHHE